MFYKFKNVLEFCGGAKYGRPEAHVPISRPKFGAVCRLYCMSDFLDRTSGIESIECGASEG